MHAKHGHGRHAALGRGFGVPSGSQGQVKRSPLAEFMAVRKAFLGKGIVLFRRPAIPEEGFFRIGRCAFSFLVCLAKIILAIGIARIRSLFKPGKSKAFVPRAAHAVANAKAGHCKGYVSGGRLFKKQNCFFRIRLRAKTLQIAESHAQPCFRQISFCGFRNPEKRPFPVQANFFAPGKKLADLQTGLRIAPACPA